MPTQSLEKNQQATLDWGQGLLDDGRAMRKAWEGIWWENLASYVGDLWAEWNVRDNKLVESKKLDHKVRLPINLSQGVVRTELAKLVKNRPITDVQAQSNEKSDLNAAEVGNKILNNYIERKFHVGRLRRRMLQWVLICGYGGIFVDYDETAKTPVEVRLDPSGIPVFDEAAIKKFQDENVKLKQTKIPQGEHRFVPLSPWQVIFDFSVNFIEDADWVIVTEVWDALKAGQRWECDPPEPQKDAIPGVIERRMLARMDFVPRSSLSISPGKTQRLCQVHRLFVKPGHYYFPEGCELVWSGDQVMSFRSYPYTHGELPVCMMGHVPLPISQYPMSVLQQVKDPVLEVSRTVSQMIENRNLMANPPWLIPKQVKLDAELVNKPGLRFRYLHVPNVPPPTPVQMPEMPAYVQNMPAAMREFILEIAGQGETSQGRVPPGARSGVAIAYLQEEDDTRLGPTVTEFEEAIERWGSLTLENTAQFYNVPRTIRIYKRHGEPEVFDFMGNQLAGNTNVICQAGSALPRSKAAKQQYILDLWDRKLEQDPRRVREMLELSEGEPDEWEIDMDQAERENRKMISGEQVKVVQWQNHPAHHYIHRRYMKSPDFEALKPEIQDEMMQHDEEHTLAEQHDAEQQQLLQGGAAGGAPPQNGAAPPQGQQAPGEPANGQNNGGPAGPYASQISPRSMIDQQPQ